MAKVGRPKKEDTPAEVERRLKAGKRMVDFRRERGWTQENLAEKLEKTALTIGRYERGKIGVKASVAKWLERETGIFWRYWTGETDCRSQRDYGLERDRENAAIEDWACEEHAREEAEYTFRLEALFFLCGYRYIRDETADFWDLDPGRDESLLPPCRHQITPYDGSGQTYHFDDMELEELLVDLKDTIGYHWFKKVEAHKCKTLKK